MMRTIKPSFKIPKGYDRLFILTIGNNFKYVLVADSNGIHTGQIGNEFNENGGMVLDFIGESMAQIRHELKVK